ncbi:diguanylate cyclase [Marinobacter sp. CHS3-4]|uniref:sensor domain-containing diguanylate cyclase n=1 Tax=Marinobacter sp. CHS3-4 TaxID=3045174 RepID=UPI0024B4C8FC|nr:diguanylate cyclase [Marinobacter sp. CHS3-4]MDI9243714.1 diguanylate cyclase [Marinobacter sp. CHS3-4]
MDKQKGQGIPLKRALSAVLPYLVVGWLWISFSDLIVSRWFKSPEAISLAQTYKGALFVLVTGLVLFIFVYRQLNQDRTLLSLQAEQQDEILKLNQFRESIIDRANVWINVLDTEGKVVLWNRAAEEISGYTRDEVMNSDVVWSLLYPDEETRETVLAKVSEILRDQGEVVGFETTICNKSGEQRIISWNSRSLKGIDDEIVGSIAIGQDVTDIREAEHMIRRRDRQLLTLMDNLPGMAYRCLYDEHWTMKFVSSGCYDVTGYAPDELIDNQVVSWASLIDSTENDRLTNEVEVAIGNAEPFSLEYPIERKDGSKAWMWERGRGVVEGDELMLEGIIMDVSDRKALEDELSEMATRDALTGLLDRREASRLLDEEIGRARRYERPLAMLWIDIDHFKQVNDELGHAAGDTVLRGFSELLSSRVRQVDLVSRFGGEEFAVVMPEMSAEEARQTAERLRQLVSDTPQRLENGKSVDLTISIGVALFPEHGDNGPSLIAAADKAMYEAKAEGRNRVVVASADQAAHTSENT